MLTHQENTHECGVFSGGLRDEPATFVFKAHQFYNSIIFSKLIAISEFGHEKPGRLGRKSARFVTTALRNFQVSII
jgi:hypothetical protein